jgi:hypothetical protein
MNRLRTTECPAETLRRFSGYRSSFTVSPTFRAISLPFPAVIRLGDGLIQITSTRKRQRIRYVVVDPRGKVTAPTVQSKSPPRIKQDLDDMTEDPEPAAEPTARELIQQRLAKLKISISDAIPYRLESVFAETSGWGGNAEIKRRAKLIGRVEPKLDEILLPNEEVLYVAKGVQHSFLESYLLGIWASLLNQTVFVLTNLRLLMMRSNSGGKPQETLWVIYYSEIEKFTPSWTGNLTLKLQDRKSLLFAGFSKRDRKAMPTIFEKAIEQYERLGFAPDVSQSRENLCSHCYQVVPKSKYVCRGCGAEYWKPRQLALRSLIFPSWGDFCMKHYGIASVELVGYVASWIAALNALASDTTDGLIIALMIFVIEHPLDAILTYNVASKGLNPRRGPDPDRIGEDKDDDDEYDKDDDDEEFDDVEEVI